MVNQVYTIEHNTGDVTKLYDFSDPKYQGLEVMSEHYYYHKPHNVRHGHSSESWRIIQCLFGVCRFESTEDEFEFSRNNKLQIIVPPLWLVHWENISGKAVVTLKECIKK